MVRALSYARIGGVPVIYAQYSRGVWDGDRSRVVREALDGLGGDLLDPLAPEEDDRFVVKPRYSAFDKTPLELVLQELEGERLLLARSATAGWGAQTPNHPPRLGLQGSG